MKVWLRDKEKNEWEYAEAVRVVEGMDKIRVFGEDGNGQEIILAMIESGQVEELMTTQDAG